MHYACRRCWWETATQEEMDQHEASAHEAGEVSHD